MGCRGADRDESLVLPASSRCLGRVEAFSFPGKKDPEVWRGRGSHVCHSLSAGWAGGKRNAFSLERVCGRQQVKVRRQ